MLTKVDTRASLRAELDAVKPAVRQFLAVVPGRDEVAAMGFGALYAKLGDARVVSATKQCLQCLHTLAVQRHQGGAEETMSVNVREFLASLMIKYYPGHVFENPDAALEKALFDASENLLDRFFGMCSAVVASDASDVPTDGFHGLMCDFFAAFRAWKAPDAARACARVVGAMKEMSSNLQGVGAGGERERLTEGIHSLNTKLATLAGGADEAKRLLALADVVVPPLPDVAGN